MKLMIHETHVFSQFTYEPLIYLSVSKWARIGQFSRPYFTVQPSEFEVSFELESPPPFEPRDGIDMLLTSFSSS